MAAAVLRALPAQGRGRKRRVSWGQTNLIFFFPENTEILAHAELQAAELLVGLLADTLKEPTEVASTSSSGSGGQDEEAEKEEEEATLDELLSTFAEGAQARRIKRSVTANVGYGGPPGGQMTLGGSRLYQRRLSARNP